MESFHFLLFHLHGFHFFFKLNPLLLKLLVFYFELLFNEPLLVLGHSIIEYAVINMDAFVKASELIVEF